MTSRHPLSVLSYRVGGVSVIALQGRVHRARRPLDQHLTDALWRGAPDVVLDVFQLEGHDPTTLEVLWSALHRVRRHGGTLTVAGAGGSLRPELAPLVDEGLAVRASVHAALRETDPRGPATAG